MASMPGDPKKRPISPRSLLELLEDDLDIYRAISDFCLLSMAGATEKIMDHYQSQMDSFFERHVDLIAKSTSHQKEIYIDLGGGLWTYVVSYNPSSGFVPDLFGGIIKISLN